MAASSGGSSSAAASTWSSWSSTASPARAAASTVWVGSMRGSCATYSMVSPRRRVIRPSSGRSSGDSPTSSRSRVVLPEPLSPTSPTRSPSWSANDTFRRTRRRPKLFETPCAVTIAVKGSIADRRVVVEHRLADVLGRHALVAAAGGGGEAARDVGAVAADVQRAVLRRFAGIAGQPAAAADQAHVVVGDGARARAGLVAAAGEGEQGGGHQGGRGQEAHAPGYLRTWPRRRPRS